VTGPAFETKIRFAEPFRRVAKGEQAWRSKSSQPRQERNLDRLRTL
jgi:hypothetical protein